MGTKNWVKIDLLFARKFSPIMRKKEEFLWSMLCQFLLHRETLLLWLFVTHNETSRNNLISSELEPKDIHYFFFKENVLGNCNKTWPYSQGLILSLPYREIVIFVEKLWTWYQQKYANCLFFSLLWQFLFRFAYKKDWQMTYLSKRVCDSKKQYYGILLICKAVILSVI